MAVTHHLTETDNKDLLKGNKLLHNEDLLDLTCFPKKEGSEE
jgi:hypothetical protein